MCQVGRQQWASALRPGSPMALRRDYIQEKSLIMVSNGVDVVGSTD